MEQDRSLRCARCDSKECRNGKDCFSLAQEHAELYADGDIGHLHSAASAIEAKHYGRKTRLAEIIEFAKYLGYERIGLAFCVGLAEEARVVDAILAKQFDVVSVCCKVCGIDKQQFDLPYVRKVARESMCNPTGQADLLNKAGSELNILCGLCVGHDAIFSMVSRAPVVTLIAKDRVLGHNPAAAVYSQYLRRQFGR
jgi:uncharacterized metal-binding protein